MSVTRSLCFPRPLADSTRHAIGETSFAFCEIVAGLAPFETVTEDDRSVAITDVNPGADGHVFVIPKRHSADLLTVAPGDLAPTKLMAQRVAQTAYCALSAEGATLRFGERGWQTVFHLNLHVVPRYRDRRRDRMELPYELGAPSYPAARADFSRAFESEIDAAV